MRPVRAIDIQPGDVFKFKDRPTSKWYVCVGKTDKGMQFELWEGSTGEIRNTRLSSLVQKRS